MIKKYDDKQIIQEYKNIFKENPDYWIMKIYRCKKRLIIDKKLSIK